MHQVKLLWQTHQFSKCYLFYRMPDSCWFFQFSTIQDQIYHIHSLWERYYCFTQTTLCQSVLYVPSEITMPTLSTIFQSPFVSKVDQFLLIVLVCYHIRKFLLYAIFLVMMKKFATNKIKSKCIIWYNKIILPSLLIVFWALFVLKDFRFLLILLVWCHILMQWNDFCFERIVWVIFISPYFGLPLTRFWGSLILAASVLWSR